MTPTPAHRAGRVPRAILRTAVAIAALLAAATAASADPDPSAGDPLRVRFIPQEDWATFLEAKGQGVVLPYPEFVKLLQSQRRAPADAAPVAVIAQSASGAATLEIPADPAAPASLSGTAEVTLAVHADGANGFWFDGGSMILRDLQVDGKPAIAYVSRGGMYAIRLEGRGAHRLTYRWQVAVTRAGADVSARGRLVPAVTSSLTVAIPAGASLDSANLVIAAGDNRMTLYPAADGSWAFTASPAVKTAPIEAVVDAVLTAHHRVESHRVISRFGWRFDVRNTGVGALVMDLPADVAILAVTPQWSGEHEWGLSKAADGRQRVTVVTNDAAPGTRRVTIDTERSLTLPATVTLPDSSSPTATFAAGETHVATVPAVVTSVTASSGAMPIAVQRVQNRPSSQWPDERGETADFLRAFRRWSGPVTLTLSVRPVARRVELRELATVQVGETEVLWNEIVSFSVKSGALYDFAATIPQGWIYLGAEVVSAPSRVNKRTQADSSMGTLPVEARDGRLFIPFSPPLTAVDGERVVRLRFRTAAADWTAGKTSTVGLPRLGIAAADGMELLDTEWIVLRAPMLTVRPVTGPESGITLVQPSLALESDSLLWKYAFAAQPREAGSTGSLTVTRAVPVTSVTAFVTYEIDDLSLVTTASVVMEIREAPLREFSFSVPAGAGDGVQIDGLGIAERIRTPGTGDNARDTWTVRLTQWVADACEYQVTWRRPHAAGAASFSLPDIRFPGARFAQAWVAIGASEQAQLAARASSGAEPVEIERFPAGDPRFARLAGRLLFAYRVPDNTGWDISAARTRFDAASAVAALLDAVVAVVVVTAEGEEQEQITYSLRNTGMQTLTLKLPEGGALWSATVDGVAVKPRKKGDLLEIPLTRTADGSNEVKIFYGRRIAALGSSGSYQPTAPQIVTGNEPAIPVQKWTWHVYLPSNLKVSRVSGSMQYEEKEPPKLIDLTLAALSKVPGAVGGRLFAVGDAITKSDESVRASRTPSADSKASRGVVGDIEEMYADEYDPEKERDIPADDPAISDSIDILMSTAESGADAPASAPQPRTSASAPQPARPGETKPDSESSTRNRNGPVGGKQMQPAKIAPALRKGLMTLVLSAQTVGSPAGNVALQSGGDVRFHFSERSTSRFPYPAFWFVSGAIAALMIAGGGRRLFLPLVGTTVILTALPDLLGAGSTAGCNGALAGAWLGFAMAVTFRVIGWLQRRLARVAQVAAPAAALLLTLGFFGLSGGDAAAQAPSPSPKVEEVFAPYDPADPKSMDKIDQVFLPMQRYRELLAGSAAEVPAAGITRIEALTLAGDPLADASTPFTATYRIDVPHENGDVVDLGLNGQTLVSVELGGQPLSYKWSKSGGLAVALPKGKHAVAVRFLPARTGRLQLAISPALTTRVDLVTRAGFAFAVSPSGPAVETPAAAATGRGRLVFDLPATPSVLLTWAASDTEGDRDATVEATVDSRLTQLRDRAALTADIAFRVRAGGVRRLAVTVPDGFVLMSVDGGGLRWRLVLEGETRVLAFQGASLVTGSQRVQIVAARADAARPAAIAGSFFRTAETFRETGTLTVTADAGERLEVLKADGLVREQADASAVRYRYFAPDYRLEYAMRPLERALTVSTRTQWAPDVQRTTAMIDVSVAASAGELHEIGFTLPAAYQVTGMSVAGGQSAERVDGEIRHITVALASPIGRSAATFQFILMRRGTPGDLALPVIGVTLRDGGTIDWRRSVLVVARPGIDLSILDAHPDLRAVDAASAERASIGGAVRFAFSGRTEQSAVRVRARALTPSLSAEAVTHLDLGDDWVNAAFEIRYDVKEAETESFRLRLPAAAGDRLDFLDPNVRDITSVRTGDTVEWTVTMRSPVSGPYRLSLYPPRQRLAMAGGKASVAILVPELPGTDRAVRFALVHNRSRHLFDVAAKPAGLDAIAEQALPFELSGAGLSGERRAFRVTDSAAGPAVALVEHVENLADTLRILVADGTAVVDPNGETRYQIEYTIVNRAHQFMPLDLPAGAVLWSLQVDDQPVRPVHAAAAASGGIVPLLVPLQQAGLGRAGVVVRVLYALPGKPLESAAGFKLVAPVTGTIEPEETVWTLWVPAGWQFDVAPSTTLQRELASTLETTRVESYNKVLDATSKAIQARVRSDNVDLETLERESQDLQALSLKRNSAQARAQLAAEREKGATEQLRQGAATADQNLARQREIQGDWSKRSEEIEKSLEKKKQETGQSAGGYLSNDNALYQRGKDSGNAANERDGQEARKQESYWEQNLDESALQGAEDKNADFRRGRVGEYAGGQLAQEEAENGGPGATFGLTPQQSASGRIPLPARLQQTGRPMHFHKRGGGGVLELTAAREDRLERPMGIAQFVGLAGLFALVPMFLTPRIAELSRGKRFGANLLVVALLLTLYAVQSMPGWSLLPAGLLGLVVAVRFLKAPVSRLLARG